MNKSMNLGGSVVSKNILEKKGRIKWCFRENGVNELDNGWRFLSDIDTDEFLEDAKHMAICDWGTIIEIEPAVAMIYELPVGTELTLEVENGKKIFVNSKTGKEL